MKRPIIGVDIDEVCADLLSAWVARYNAKYNDTVKVEDIRGWEVSEYCTKCSGNKLHDLLTPDIYDEVKPIPRALEGIGMLRQIGRVVFITAGNGTAKLAWTKRHGFLPDKHEAADDFFMARDKTLIRAHYLLDDHVKNIKLFPGKGILISHHHNADEALGPRAADLIEAAALIKADLNWYKFAP